MALGTPSPQFKLRWLLYPVAAAAAAVALFYSPDRHRRPVRTLSPADAAAMERVIAGQGISISPLEGIPNVSVEYYDVDATDPAGIRQEMYAKGPIDKDGQHFDANTNWSYRWSWGGTFDGSCGAASADVSFTAVITLPHLTHFAALKPEDAQVWRSYMTALAFHEAHHVQNGYGGNDAVTNAVRSSTCDQANAAGNEAIAKLNREDERYDERTNHGVTDGALYS